ncbi:C1 family peptidase [Methanobrevibacter sp.]|uniref:C1 family peptidase n=1 Tax=Methanobrevibacter sp. TaxID=66852 RepID=UPI00388ED4D6
MRICKLSMVLLILILSLGAVSATDNITDDVISDIGGDIIQITDNDIYTNSSSTFTDLKNDINASGDTFELTKDYKFDSETDEHSPIFIERGNFIIKGNGHIIDANNENAIFKITANNVTINNLTFINSNGRVLDVQPSASLTTNNIVFKDNYGSLGIIFVSGAEYTSNNDQFINLVADNYGPILFQMSSLILNNAKIISNEQLDNAFIFSYGNNRIFIINNTFSNITSKYNPVLRGAGFDEISILNSKFVNLYAELSGGAIGLKNTVSLTIDNCTFNNISSQKNGGVIFNDVTGNSEGFEGNFTITNSNFSECYSEFGGCVLQLGGVLKINNTNFNDNYALFDGGAIYTSYSVVSVENSTFTSNNALYDGERGSFGGAIYVDKGILEIEESEFINNSAQAGGAISTYDSSMDVTNSNFDNNGEAIFSTFDDEVNLIDNNFNNDTYSLNNTNYAYVLSLSGLEIKIINNTINVAGLPSRFDLRDWGWVTSVKNQGNKGSCWTFGLCGAVESALLKSTGIYMDFSENNVENSAIAYSIYGNPSHFEEATQYTAVGYAVSWFGMLPIENDEYDQYGKISPLIYSNQSVHIQDVIFVMPRINFTDNNNIKDALIKYGALMVLYLGDSGSESFYNPETYGQYCYDENAMPNHAVTLVGWDDNYSKENFLVEAPENGAWIIKNSWGESFGDNGYCYVSYYDTTFTTISPAIGFILNNTIPYNNNYQYDIGGLSNTVDQENISYKNIYEAYEDDLIAAVGTYFFVEDRSYSLNVSVNGELKHTQSGEAPLMGFNTIKLTNYIPIKEGDIFEVEITANSLPYLSQTRQHFMEGVSFSNAKGYWEDMASNESVACLKVYTLPNPIITQDLVKYYRNASQFVADVGVANATVLFEINGVNYTRTSNENGSAKIAINLYPGVYSIKTHYDGVTVVNNITVLSTLYGQNLVKYFQNASQFYIGLVDGEGSPLTGMNVTMNINGVFYNRTTNENGTAKLNINLSPGEYILTAIDPLTGLMMSYNITVLPVLSAENMNMTYLDGSKFTAKILDGEGNPLANVTITFNINGVFYNRTTNSSGFASLNIRLIPGEYIITSMYGNAVIANTITITAKD